MKWIADWWGLYITAESKDDEKLLKELLARLPAEADDIYEIGKLKQVTEAPLVIEFRR